MKHEPIYGALNTKYRDFNLVLFLRVLRLE